jgi:hypothetical protein
MLLDGTATTLWYDFGNFNLQTESDAKQTNGGQKGDATSVIELHDGGGLPLAVFVCSRLPPHISAAIFLSALFYSPRGLDVLQL